MNADWEGGEREEKKSKLVGLQPCAVIQLPLLFNYCIDCCSLEAGKLEAGFGAVGEAWEHEDFRV